MLGSQTVVDIERDKVSFEAIHDPFTEVMVCVKIAKHPTSPVEVDVGCSLLRVSVAVDYRSRLKDPHLDLPILHRTLLLGDAINIWTNCSSV